MNSTSSTSGIQLQIDEFVPASGTWSIAHAPGMIIAWVSAREFVKQAGLGFALAISPVTFGVDPWFVDRRRLSAVTQCAPADAPQRRRITRQDARRIALLVLLKAEKARCQFAEEESRRGIDWGA